VNPRGFSSKNKLSKEFLKKLKLFFVSDNILGKRASMKILLFRYKITLFIDSSH